jgi:hypothetical protein
MEGLQSHQPLRLAVSRVHPAIVVPNLTTLILITHSYIIKYKCAESALNSALSAHLCKRNLEAVNILAGH